MIPKMSRMLGTQMTSRLTTKRRHNAIEMWRTQWKGLSGNRSWRRALRIWKHKMTKKLKLFKHLPCIQKLFTESFNIKGTLHPKMKINILFYHLLKLRPPQMYVFHSSNEHKDKNKKNLCQHNASVYRTFKADAIFFIPVNTFWNFFNCKP